MGGRGVVELDNEQIRKIDGILDGRVTRFGKEKYRMLS